MSAVCDPDSVDPMQRMTLDEFLRTYDLYDKGVDAITQDDAGRVRFVFGLFHCDDPERNDETKDYRLTAIFQRRDVVVHEGDLQHAEGEWWGTILDLQADRPAVRIGISWCPIPGDDTSWTSLSLLDGPIHVEETVSEIDSPGSGSSGASP